MAALSKANIALKALEVMGVKPVGQSASSDDSSDLEECYENLYEELQADGLVEWASDANVPAKYVEPIANLMGLYRSGQYDLPAENLRRIIDFVGVDGEKGKNKISRLMASDQIEGMTYAGNYF